ncbi:UvrD-helicase domain-containing protein [Pseudomonas aeruginosa]|uniref:UvrD-helicase domain-containing protein n=1 Tax=Pseudomonas aeruginosa TaxID=287 RepID=UPI0026EDB2ED|nr:UvrD-helicase domain-containing protein [Pseudomonas aeruginosa]
MKYVAIAQKLAEWLLPKTGLVALVYDSLRELGSDGGVLKDTDFVQDGIRISYDQNSGVCALWHSDYISGTGSEDWGIIKWTGSYSLTEMDSIGREVLERCLYVANQRLQGLLLDGSMIHRAYDNGAHTLLAGRGNTAHHHSIAYAELVHGSDSLQSRSCMIVGPEQSFFKLSEEAAREGRELPKLCAAANALVSPRTRSKTIASSETLPALRELVAYFFQHSYQTGLFGEVEVRAENGASAKDHVRYLTLTYDKWMHPDSPLGDAKRRILAGQNIDIHPLRILGPGGSGKTLLMQLLAIGKLKSCESIGRKCRILYIAHSKAMEAKAKERLGYLLGQTLGPNGEVNDSFLTVTTLADYCRVQLGVELQSVLDADADTAKQFQLEQTLDALNEVRAQNPTRVEKSALLKQVFAEPRLLKLFSYLVLVEISAAIKGHGLESDKKRYVESEKSLSLLHGNLSQVEREFIFDTFLSYHRVVFGQYSVLDPDDIAISLAARLRTPVWQLRRQHEGFDYVLVDEAQLFNENERRLFPLLTKSDVPHVPIALALDQAQATYGQSSAGLSTIGIKGITNETLLAVHRSTEAIVRLAFFVIQRSTELFGPDFPDFTKTTERMLSDKHQLAAKPAIERQSQDSQDIGRFVLKRIRELRKANTRQIAVICYSDIYWNSLESVLSTADLPFQVISERGAKFPEDHPLVSLVKPAQVGGQEFDSVILVGLESGLTPPVIVDNQALATAVEQQVIRDMYLGITRARYRVVVVISKGNMPNKLLEQAAEAGLITD